MTDIQSLISSVSISSIVAVSYLLQYFGAPTRKFQTATKCTAIWTVQETMRLNFKQTIIHSDNNSITSAIGDTDVYPEDDENYGSSIISD
jgi:hypothetical protein